jgi:hypothetical protein
VAGLHCGIHDRLTVTPVRQKDFSPSFYSESKTRFVWHEGCFLPAAVRGGAETMDVKFLLLDVQWRIKVPRKGLGSFCLTGDIGRSRRFGLPRSSTMGL